MVYNLICIFHGASEMRSPSHKFDSIPSSHSPQSVFTPLAACFIVYWILNEKFEKESGIQL